MTMGNHLFKPWKGNQYGNESIFKIPILIVGESNYTDNLEKEKPHDTFTHRLISSIIDASWKHRFFSNIQRTFVENADTEDSRKQFWNSVAHHEYIQDWLPKHGVPPTKEMWEKAKPIFLEVVTELKPKCILFVCKRVYTHVALDFSPSDSLIFNCSNRNTLQVQDALATYVNHPTRYGFRNSRGVVHELILKSGGNPQITL
ncbi:hypothetical protein [Chamaesiphon sp. VAR_69_metabat_338]|uniref:hypothetical protein n=1 Tax=Chamaesiphon sp. VAR_69_metabat_338 TaxID=2964704 RepID=UPI00286E91C9|nr:hypothetical protein [Chamaesiphon sp. VAR_69_metabat_338]